MSTSPPPSEPRIRVDRKCLACRKDIVLPDFTMAFQPIVDVETGHSGLGMLADFQPDVIKIDMGLVRGIHADRVRRAIARSIVTLCHDLNISVIAEGIETLDEAITMRELGVRLFQGCFFARPALEQLPVVPPDATAAVRSGHETALLEGERPRAQLPG